MGLNKKAQEAFGTLFLKNIVTQLLGTGIAQIIPVLATLILAKLYSPSDFALYTNFIAFSAVLIVMAGGNYHFAIVLPKKNKDNEANYIFVISLLITLLIALLIGGLAIIFESTLQKTFGLQDSLVYLPLYVFTYGAWLAFTNLSIRQMSFRSIAISKVIQALVYSLVGILIGYYLFRTTGLIIGKWLGILGGVTFLYFTTKFSIKGIKRSELKKIAIRYKNYPKFGIFPALLNTISLQAMVFTLQIFYSEDILGYYGFTLLVLTAPLALIGASFKDVFYQKVASLINEDQHLKAQQLFINSSKILTIIAIFMALILFLWGEALFKLFFGIKWITSGQFASILGLSFAVKLVVSPLSSIFNATDNLKIAAVWQTAYFFSTILLLIISAYVLRLEIQTLLIVYMIHEVLLYLIYFVIQHNLIHKTSKKYNS